MKIVMDYNMLDCSVTVPPPLSANILKKHQNVDRTDNTIVMVMSGKYHCPAWRVSPVSVAAILTIVKEVSYSAAHNI